MTNGTFDGPVPIEPAASYRQFAHGIRSMYVALERIGFEDDQAFHLTVTWMEAVAAATADRLIAMNNNQEEQ